jgi:pre-60S factor REI1
MATTTQPLTSTTAPGKVFANRAELAEHYKSDYHKYNCKRREAGLPLLLEQDFLARLQAAQAMRYEQQQQKRNTGHLKNKNGKRVVKAPNQVSLTTKNEHNEQQEPEESAPDAMRVESANEDELPDGGEEQDEDMEITIDPNQCLFDHKQVFDTVQENLQYMLEHYGFFVPDREFLTDPTGLVGYCHEKICIGQVCLYCQKTLRSPQACIQHMISTTHTKLRYEAGVDLEDLNLFYDFSKANQEFANRRRAASTLQKESSGSDRVVSSEVDEEWDHVASSDADEDWEDMSDDENEDGEPENEDEDPLMDDQYQTHIGTMGFDITPLGELVFPDGRVVGHRALRHYYKQRIPASTMNAARQQANPALRAAKQAAGERLFRGNVYQIGADHELTTANEHKFMQLQRAGIVPGLAAGRAAKGILVVGMGASFSQISVYRYRAALRKQQHDERKGRKIQQHTTLPMNRMDKKANRLHNNVSVAHALR